MVGGWGWRREQWKIKEGIRSHCPEEFKREEAQDVWKRESDFSMKRKRRKRVNEKMEERKEAIWKEAMNGDVEDRKWNNMERKR
jgi:hypothetical protein